MSGHSKFANIKHKKMKTDAVRGRIFTRLGKELAVAVKSGGPNPESNGKLKDIIAKAKSSNMPGDTIDRCIKKAAGDLDAVNYEHVVYEGYGPAGVAIIVEALTDNRHRTAANVRSAFTKGGGNMGQTGCVSFSFNEKGVIMVEDGIMDEDALMLLALDAGASDLVKEEGGFTIYTEPDEFSAVAKALADAGVETVEAHVGMVPDTYQSLTEPDDIKKMNKMLDLLDEEEDVQEVWHNWDMEDGE